MVKAFLKGNIALLVAIVMLIPVIIVYSTGLNNTKDYEYILEHGIETEGYIIPDSYKHQGVYMNEDYYSISYYFYDEDFNKHVDETASYYSYNEIMELNYRESIKVRYDSETFDSVEAIYKTTGKKFKNSVLIIICILGVVDLIAWIFAIRLGLLGISLLKVEKEGKEYSARVECIAGGLVVNGVPKCKVRYVWDDELGNIKKGWSRYVYTHKEGLALEKQFNIVIKAIGKRSFIVTKPDLSLLDNEPKENLEIPEIAKRYDKYVKKNKVIVCEYCGHKQKWSDDNTCKNCGARLKDK